VNDTVLNCQPGEANHIQDKNRDLPRKCVTHLLIDFLDSLGKLISDAQQTAQKRASFF
jgi:hypothetical protein